MRNKVDDQSLIAVANEVYGQFSRHELKVSDMETSTCKLRFMQKCINLLIKRGYSYTANSEQGVLNFTQERDRRVTHG